MTLTEILSSLQKLSHQEKIKAIQFLATELAQEAQNLTTESLEYGEINTELNFQRLSEQDMIEQSKSALETYLHTDAGVKHEQVQKWADSLTINNNNV